MQHENMFSFEAIGWFREWSEKIFYSKAQIPYLWIKIKVGNKHNEYRIFTVFLDRINIEQVTEIKYGSLIKLNGFISSAKNSKVFFIPTRLKIIADNEVKNTKEFSKLNTLSEKEDVAQNNKQLDVDNVSDDIDDEIVEIVW